MSQHTSVSMDGTDPAGWDPKLDSLTAAPANHRLLYEDDPFGFSRSASRRALRKIPIIIAGHRFS